MSAYRRHARLTWPLTAEQLQNLDREIDALYRAVKAGGGGAVDLSNLDADNLTSGTVPDARLVNQSVSPGTYGDSTHVSQVTVDAKGRVTAAANVAIGTSTGIVTASAYRATSDQTLTHNTEAAITLGAVDFDVSSCWSAGSPTRLTIPTAGDGSYLVHGCVKLAAGFQGSIHVRLYKNGSLVTEETSQGVDDAAAEYHHVTSVLSVVATDYVEMKVLLELAAGSGTYGAVFGSGNTFLQIGRLASQTGTVTAGNGIQIASNAISAKLNGSSLTNGASGLSVTVPAGLTLLQTLTASASATLDFASAISASYDDYLIEFVNLVPASNAVHLQMRMSTDGGATYDSGANYGWGILQFDFNFVSTTGVGAGGNSGLTEIRLFHSAANTANYSINGVARLSNPGGANYKAVMADFHGRVSDGNLYRDVGTAHYLSTTAVNAVRFFMSSGNITSGFIRIYGLVKS